MSNQIKEKFSKEEAYFVSPFFTNIDKNIFAAKYLPSEVLGALASRYSRSTKGVRRLFFDEYIKPILEPDLEGAGPGPLDHLRARRRQDLREEHPALAHVPHISRTLSSNEGLQGGRRHDDEVCEGGGTRGGDLFSRGLGLRRSGGNGEAAEGDGG